MSAIMSHEDLMHSYMADLRAALETVHRKRAGRLKTWTKRLGSEARAREKLADQGPYVVEPRVIGVLRKYWFACEEINRRSAENSRPPQQFLYDDLLLRDTKLARFVDELPFWPVGTGEPIDTDLPYKFDRNITHDQLFNLYLTELETAISRANQDFDGSLVRKSSGFIGGRVPICVDPRVIGVLAGYGLMCARLNTTSVEFVNPRQFVEESLSGKKDALWDLVTELPLLPPGTDENDEWV